MTDPRRYARILPPLTLLAAAVFLAGNADVPLWDRDEPRYAQCSRQMLQTGDWVVPRLYDDLRTAKPPVIYWLQATAMSVFGENEFAARFPSAVGVALTLVLVGAAVRRAAGIEHAFWTVLVLASNVLVVVAAKSSLTDGVLLLLVTAGQLCLFQIWRGRGTWPVVVALGLADGVALMTKGPVVFGVHAMTLVGLAFLKWSLGWTAAQRKLVLVGLLLVAMASLAGDYGPALLGRKQPVPMWLIVAVQAVVVLVLAAAIARGRRGSDVGGRTSGVESHDSHAVPEPALDPRPTRRSAVAAKALAYLVLIVAVGLPWAVLLEQRSPGFMKTMVFKEVGSRAAVAQEGHQGPWGYYLASVWPTFLPWSLLLPAALVLGWKRRADPRVRFALAAVLGPWLMFEEVRTKLPHYLLPCFVPLAYLAAEAIVQCLRHGVAALSDAAFRRAVGVWAAILIALGLAPLAAAYWFTPQPWAAIVVLALVTTAYAVVVAGRLRRGQTEQALTFAGVGGLLLFAVVFRVYLPACDFLRLSQRAAGVLRDNGVTGREQVVMLDYKEPSLAFYQGGTIREHSNLAITPRLLDPVPRWARPALRGLHQAMGWKFTPLPEWAVVTRDVWDRSAPKAAGQEDARAMLDVVATFRGLDVADGMRDVEVMVVRRKAGASVEGAAGSQAGKPTGE
jgi:4-amino-4-deoxy-L-arabinose transferase-like glycosyltransferase